MDSTRCIRSGTQSRSRRDQVNDAPLDVSAPGDIIETLALSLRIECPPASAAVVPFEFPFLADKLPLDHRTSPDLWAGRVLLLGWGWW